MANCFFVSDLHGKPHRYERLFEAIGAEIPPAVFIGGDLFPHAAGHEGVPSDFLGEYLGPLLERTRQQLKDRYPAVFVILGNDDARSEEAAVKTVADRGLWHYAHRRRYEWGRHEVYGYACVPPSPFLLNDWEKYDVSRYTPHGSVSPEEGYRSVPVDPRDIRHATIKQDLEELAGTDDVTNALFLFHTPPHETRLDRAALDGRMIDHVPFDVHVGSIAVRRFIEARQPLITLHGHIHESTRLTGEWRDRIGRTHSFNAAHDGPELSLVRFDPSDPAGAKLELL